MTRHRSIKNALYGELSRVAKAVASTKRLELVDLLCQAPRSVEALACEAGIGIALASAHLRELRLARLVETRRQGRQVIYSLSSPAVAGLLVALRSLAADRSLEIQGLLARVNRSRGPWVRTDGPTLLRKARRGEVTVIDVRPPDEFAERHLPHARNIPIAELARRRREIPKGRPVVAYCRGPYCLWASEAVAILEKSGYEAYSWPEGGSDWLACKSPASDAAVH